MMRGIVLSLVFLSNFAWASMQSSYQEGSNYAKSLQENAKNTLIENTLQDVPRFETATPQEANLSQGGIFDGAIHQSLTTNEGAQTIIETAKVRQRFEIDPNQDPLFQVNQEKSAEEILSIKKNEVGIQEDESIEKTCEEGGEDITYECFENRHVSPNVPMKKTTLFVNHLEFSPRIITERVVVRPGNWRRHTQWGDRQRQDGWILTLPREIKAFKEKFCPKFSPVDVQTKAVFNLDCERIKSFEINQASVSEVNGHLTIVTPSPVLNITLHHDTYEGEESDEWHSQCDSFEEMVDLGLCQYGERVLSVGPETRNIQGYSIFKEAWQYRQVYHCKMIKDDCHPLKLAGCHQIGSKCKEMKEGKCWIYERTYQCPQGKLSQSKVSSPASEVFCLTGDCHDNSYQANGEIFEAISRLSLLKQIQDDMQGEGNFQIFKGSQHHCSRNCVSFKDCCGGLKGWGVSLHIAGCSADEQQLAKMREKNLCYQIGTYCAKKILKKCVSKKTTFCCFGSRFARLLQEQGRPQLNVSWGAVECPDCRGFTVDELSRIDLGKINFNEVFDEVMKNYKTPNVELLQQNTSQKIQENLKQIENGLKTKSSSKAGVLDDNKTTL